MWLHHGKHLYEMRSIITVAGLLVILKNITRGLKHILLKSHWTSSFVKYLAPQSWETSWEIRGRGYQFLTVMAFSAR